MRCDDALSASCHSLEHQAPAKTLVLSQDGEFNSRAARTVPIRAIASVNRAPLPAPSASVLNGGSTRNVA